MTTCTISPKKAFTNDHASLNSSHFYLLERLNLNPAIYCFSLTSGLSFALLSLDLAGLLPDSLLCAQQGKSVSRAQEQLIEGNPYRPVF